MKGTMKGTGVDPHNGSFDFDESYYKKSGMSARIIKHHCPNCNCLGDGKLTLSTSSNKGENNGK